MTMRRTRMGLAIASIAVLGVMFFGTHAVFAETTETLQDFENPNPDVAGWGGATTTVIDDDSVDGSKALQITWEDTADAWAGVNLGLGTAFTEDFTILRLRFKGTGSKKRYGLYLNDSGSERYSTSITDKVDGWTTLEFPIKKFALDGWQAPEADNNKKKDFPMKILVIQRLDDKKASDFCIDLIEAVK